MIESRVTELLDIKYPIFQGGMARISDASLAFIKFLTSSLVFSYITSTFKLIS